MMVKLIIYLMQFFLWEFRIFFYLQIQYLIKIFWKIISRKDLYAQRQYYF